MCIKHLRVTLLSLISCFLAKYMAVLEGKKDGKGGQAAGGLCVVIAAWTHSHMKHIA